MAPRVLINTALLPPPFNMLTPFLQSPGAGLGVGLGLGLTPLMTKLSPCKVRRRYRQRCRVNGRSKDCCCDCLVPTSLFFCFLASQHGEHRRLFFGGVGVRF